MHIPKGKNSYCGPFAIAALSGGTTDEAARIARLITGKRAIRSMNINTVRKVLWRLGIENARTDYYREHCPTLKQWIDNKAKPDTSYIVLVTGHYLVIRNNRVACAQRPEWTRLDDSPGKRRRVISVLQVV